MTQTRPLKTNLFNRNADLLHGPIFKNLFLFMLPILVSNLFQQLYNTVDTMIVGNVLGDTALAAIGSCGSIYELLVGFGIGIGNGLSIVLHAPTGHRTRICSKGRCRGAGHRALRKLCHYHAGFFGLRPLLQLLDTPAEILEDAYRYIIVIDLGVLVMFFYNLCAGLLRAIGNSVMPLVFLLISSGLNVALDLWFIAGLGMGVQGAAVATVIAQGISVVLCILYVMRRVPLLLPARKHWAVGQHLYWELFSQSISMADEQHRVGGVGGAAIRHQRSGHTDHCRAHRRAQAVLLYQYAADLHGKRRLHLCLPEPGRSPAGAGAQGNAHHVPVLGGHHGGRGGADAAFCPAVGAADLRFLRAPRAGKRRTVSDVERAVLRGAGSAAVHPVRFAEPWAEGAAAVFQRHRACGKVIFVLVFIRATPTTPSSCASPSSGASWRHISWRCTAATPLCIQERINK